MEKIEIELKNNNKNSNVFAYAHHLQKKNEQEINLKDLKEVLNKNEGKIIQINFN